MSFPGFDAESSLHRSQIHYRQSFSIQFGYGVSPSAGTLPSQCPTQNVCPGTLSACILETCLKVCEGNREPGSPQGNCCSQCTTCVDLQTDSLNCGSCFNNCNDGSNQRSCVKGACEYTGGCNYGYSKCANTCVALGSDQNNCGACGTTCSSGQVCCGGTCCSGACCEGVCRDTSSDSSNCGTCGNVCTGGNVCSNGACVSPCDTCTNCHFDSFNFGWFLGPIPIYLCRCNGQSCGLNGSCCTQCPPGQNFCYNVFGPIGSVGGCTDTSSDNNNCGGCSYLGLTNKCATGQGEQCVNGSCQCLDPSKGCGSAVSDTTGSITISMAFGAYSSTAYSCTGGGTITVKLGNTSQSKTYSYSGTSSIQPNGPGCVAPSLTFASLKPGNWTITWTDDGIPVKATCTANVVAGQTANVQIVDDVCMQ
jgi:hypothetical protein